MSMDALKTFFDMGGYAEFIWPVYGMAALVCGVVWWRTSRALKQLETDEQSGVDE